MATIVKPQNLLPAPPNAQKGWGRLVWIVKNLSTAPLELKLGFGAMVRGAYQILPQPPAEPHGFVWDGWLPLQAWGIIVAVLGFVQFYGCLYRWERWRTWAATLLAGSLAYITGKHVLASIYGTDGIAAVLYGTLMVGEIWIAIRGWPAFGGAPLNGVSDVT